MNGNTRSEPDEVRSIVDGPRVTAAVRRTERGDVLTEYRAAGNVYRDVDALEAALRGEASGAE